MCVLVFHITLMYTDFSCQTVCINVCVMRAGGWEVGLQGQV
jgi:hypothetical protein